MNASNFDAALEALYATFARYPLAPHVEGCTHCVDASDHEAISSKPLRRLTPQDLRRFAFKALTTWGTEEDLKHFLPRLFELLTQGLARELNVPIVLGKLPRAGWPSWPQPEVDAVTRYLSALWARILTEPALEPALELDELLAGYSLVFDDLSAHLAAWEADTSANATRQLALLVDRHATTLYGSRQVDGAWWRDPGRSQVSRWLYAGPQLERLERAFFAGGPDAALLARAADCLGWIR